ncbi:mucin-2-like [Haliotis asinina]|uniref:mucin-2-like n=1 Tax=Haliotis asinina TaxID=109174 RepID=UPI003531B3E8
MVSTAIAKLSSSPMICEISVKGGKLTSGCVSSHSDCHKHHIHPLSCTHTDHLTQMNSCNECCKDNLCITRTWANIRELHKPTLECPFCKDVLNPEICVRNYRPCHSGHDICHLTTNGTHFSSKCGYSTSCTDVLPAPNAAGCLTPRENERNCVFCCEDWECVNQRFKVHFGIDHTHSAIKHHQTLVTFPAVSNTQHPPTASTCSDKNLLICSSEICHFEDIPALCPKSCGLCTVSTTSKASTCSENYFLCKPEICHYVDMDKLCPMTCGVCTVSPTNTATRMTLQVSVTDASSTASSKPASPTMSSPTTTKPTSTAALTTPSSTSASTTSPTSSATTATTAPTSTAAPTTPSTSTSTTPISTTAPTTTTYSTTNTTPTSTATPTTPSPSSTSATPTSTAAPTTTTYTTTPTSTAAPTTTTTSTAAPTTPSTSTSTTPISTTAPTTTTYTTTPTSTAAPTTTTYTTTRTTPTSTAAPTTSPSTSTSTTPTYSAAPATTAFTISTTTPTSRAAQTTSTVVSTRSSSSSTSTTTPTSTATFTTTAASTPIPTSTTATSTTTTPTSTATPTEATSTVHTTTASPTTPAVHRSCYQCGSVDDGTYCTLQDIYIPHATSCPAGTGFCMTDIEQNIDGTTNYIKRCVNQNQCEKLWYEQTSDISECVDMDPTSLMSAMTCRYCCTTDNCNGGKIPAKETLYNPKN